MSDDQLTENHESIKLSIEKLLESDEDEQDFYKKMFANPLTCDTSKSTRIENPINMFEIKQFNKTSFALTNSCETLELAEPLREKDSDFDVFNMVYHFASVKKETEAEIHNESTNTVQNWSPFATPELSFSILPTTQPTSPSSPPSPTENIPSLLDVLFVRVPPDVPDVPVQQAQQARPPRRAQSAQPAQPALRAQPVEPARPAPRAQPAQPAFRAPQAQRFVPARPAVAAHPNRQNWPAIPTPARSRNSSRNQENKRPFCHICYLKQVNNCEQSGKPRPEYFVEGAPWNNHNAIGTKTNSTLISCPWLFFDTFPDCIAPNRRVFRAHNMGN